MKFCPYCHEKISYLTLIKYSFGEGFTKHEHCPHCNKVYKVTLNLIFASILIITILGILIFLLKSSGRFQNRLYSFILLVISLPLFPFFIKLSKEEE